MGYPLSSTVCRTVNKDSRLQLQRSFMAVRVLPGSALPDVKYHQLLNGMRCRRPKHGPQAQQSNLHQVVEALLNKFRNMNQPCLQGLQSTQSGNAALKRQDQPTLPPQGPVVPWSQNVTPTKSPVHHLSTVPWPAASLYMLCSNRTGRSSLAAVSR